MVAKADGHIYYSPTYAFSFIIFDPESAVIQIHVFDKSNFDNPFILSQYKILNDLESDSTALFYTIEGNIISWDYHENEIMYNFEDELLNYNWKFEDLKNSSVVEYLNYFNTFNPEHPETANLSDNDHNLIGYSSNKILDKCSSEYYLMNYDGRFLEVGKDQPILFFKDKFDQNVLFLLNEQKICTSINYIYDYSYYNDITIMLNEVYGNENEKFWIEYTENGNYIYLIDKKPNYFNLMMLKQ